MDPSSPQAKKGERIPVFPEKEDESKIGKLGTEPGKDPLRRGVEGYGFQIYDGPGDRPLPHDPVQPPPGVTQSQGVLRLEKLRQMQF